MSDTEFDHDAEANEYHIAVKQQLYEDIAALRSQLAREAVVSEAQRDRLDIANARIRELGADARLRLTREDLLLGMSAATYAAFVVAAANPLLNSMNATAHRYEAALDAAVKDAP